MKSASYAEPAWTVAVVLAVVLHSYRYVLTGNVCCCVWINWDACATNTYYFYPLSHNFVSSYGHGRDCTSGDPILADHTLI